MKKAFNKYKTEIWIIISILAMVFITIQIENNDHKNTEEGIFTKKQIDTLKEQASDLKVKVDSLKTVNQILENRVIYNKKIIDNNKKEIEYLKLIPKESEIKKIKLK